jgi:hypothetical protein
MAVRPVGICSDLSAAAATAFPRVELNPVSPVIQLTEYGISLNAAPNSTEVPVEFNIQRNTLVATGSAGNVEEMQSDLTAGLQATALVECSANGAGTIDILHRHFVPNVSGLIWVAAPGREVDCIAAEFLAIINQATLGSGINAACYMVWEE